MDQLCQCIDHVAARCKCCITFCVIRSDMSPCQMSSKKHHCVWSMLLAGSCKTSWANVPGPSSFVQRTSASPLQLCGRRVHSQDLPCCGANCGLAPPHLQVDERCWSQCLGAFRHEEQCLQLSAPCSHEAALMLFVLLMCCLACCCSMILAKPLCTRVNCLHHLRLCCPPC